MITFSYDNFSQKQTAGKKTSRIIKSPMHNRVGTLGNFMSTFGFFLFFSSSCKPFFGIVVLILVVKVVLGSFFWISVAVLWKKTCKLDAFFSLVLSFVDNNDLVADWLVGGLKFGVLGRFY